MKIAIVGDACTDIYVYGSCDRLCPEGPVPVLNKIHQIDSGGMALNVFNNLKTFFGEDVDFYSNDLHNILKVRYVEVYFSDFIFSAFALTSSMLPTK